MKYNKTFFYVNNHVSRRHALGQRLLQAPLMQNVLAQLVTDVLSPPHTDILTPFPGRIGGVYADQHVPGVLSPASRARRSL